jgi:hypothetical protein
MPPYEKMFFTIAISTKIFFAGPKGILNPLGPSCWIIQDIPFHKSPPTILSCLNNHLEGRVKVQVVSLKALAASPLLGKKFLPGPELVPFIPSKRPVPLINSLLDVAERVPLSPKPTNRWNLSTIVEPSSNV